MKSVLNIHWKDWWWSSSNTLATWCKEPTYQERLWCWDKLKAGREGDDRGWDGHQFEQALGVDDGQGSLACCSPYGHKESDTTEWLNWTEVYICESQTPNLFLPVMIPPLETIDLLSISVSLFCKFVCTMFF